MSYRSSDQQLSVKVLLQIDSICYRCETARKAGEAAPIDSCLQGLSGPSRQLALRELLMLESAIASARAKALTPDTYLHRFPNDRDVVALASGRRRSCTAAHKPKGAEAETHAFRPLSRRRT